MLTSLEHNALLKYLRLLASTIQIVLDHTNALEGTGRQEWADRLREVEGVLDELHPHKSLCPTHPNLPAPTEVARGSENRPLAWRRGKRLKNDRETMEHIEADLRERMRLKGLLKMYTYSAIAGRYGYSVNTILGYNRALEGDVEDDHDHDHEES